MSRVGSKEINIPESVKINLQDGLISAEGPLGKLESKLNSQIEVIKKGKKITTKLELKIINERGLHARASAKFAAIVDSYKSVVEVSKDNLVVPGNSIMGLLTLAAEKGSVISIKITGKDEKVLEEKLKSLVNNYFGEGI